jgi:ABC-2 type transport system permease protein
MVRGTAVREFAFETYYLGLRTTRRFLRVPANWISILFFPLIQLIAFSQLYQDIIQLPGFGGQSSYLAYLAPGQVAFTAFLAVSWSGYGLLVEYRTGYLDKLRANPIGRWSILAGEMVPLFFQAAAMAGLLLIVSLLMGATLVTGVGGFLLILALSGGFGIAMAGTSFIPALLTKSEQATSALSLMLFPVVFISTAFVPEALMPGWMQVVNRWNPVTYLIEAIRSLMVTGYDWVAIGKALFSMAIVGVILQVATLWSFHRLAR